MARDAGASGPPSRRPLTGGCFLGRGNFRTGLRPQLLRTNCQNWSTRIGNSPVRTLLPVPICDRSRLVHSGAKADIAGGPNWPGVCIRLLSRIRALAPLAGALRRLRIVGGVGIVFGYSRDEPASGERLQVRLQRVSNLLGIDLPVVHVKRKGF